MVPALAIADVLTDRGHTVEFCGAGHGMEGRLVPEAGYRFHRVRIRGFERHLGLGTIKTLASIPLAGVEAWNVLREVRPDCVVGVGAYASGPVVAEAAVRRIPSVAVEMDAHLGWTNRVLSRLVDKVCLSFPIPGCEGGKFVYTGRPAPKVAQCHACGRAATIRRGGGGAGLADLWRQSGRPRVE